MLETRVRTGTDQIAIQHQRRLMSNENVASKKTRSGVARKFLPGGANPEGLPLPSLPLPLSSPFLSLLFPHPLSLPSLTLEVGPLKSS